LPVSAQTLWKRMYERKLLASRDEKRQRMTVRRSLGGQQRREVIHLRNVTERALGDFLVGMRHRKARGKVGLAAWTIRNYLVALKTALTWVADQKLVPAVPKFPDIKVPKFKPQPVPAEAFEKLLDKAPDARWRASLLCGWFEGLRLAEAYALRRTRSTDFPWLDVNNDRIILPATFAKSDEDQWLPLHPLVREALLALPDDGNDRLFLFRSRKGGGPLSEAGVSQFVRLLAKRAGVRLGMHKLRKGFGCRVAQQLGRGNAPVLHRLMRHSSMQLTMDFYANVDDVLHDAIGQLT
jgi:integrase